MNREAKHKPGQADQELRPMTQRGCQMISSWRLLRPPLRSLTLKMKVLPVPVRDDNYAYLIIDEAEVQSCMRRRFSAEFSQRSEPSRFIGMMLQRENGE